MLNGNHIAAEQCIGAVLAIPAFVPITVCTGYLAGWFSDLYGFRRRSLVERIFWSIPLSISLSTIGSVLIGRFLSLRTVAVLLVILTAVWLVVMIREWLVARRSGSRISIGLQPMGLKCLLIMLVWAAVIIVSLIDWQRDQRLWMSLTVYDHGARVNWAESILRTGIPPANPMYFYQHASDLRYYYFWLVDCASVVKIWSLPMRAVLAASCVWAAIALAAITGLYLKHFLETGVRLRRQFFIAISLFAVGGATICVYLWNMLILHIPAPGDVWKGAQIADWITFFLFKPHHLVSMACCMFAFLLAWMPGEGRLQWAAKVVFIGAALASAFGMSVYVAFAFFLISLAWSCWEIATEREWRRIAILAAGGAIACVMLLPYLWEISHSASKMAAGSVFEWSVRETIPPDRLLASRLLRGLASSHADVARELANLVLLLPGYAIELGAYSLFLVALLFPRWRSRKSLTFPQRTLLFIALVTLPITSFIRSGVISINDFGVNSALFLEFPLLLLASEMIVGWATPDRAPASPMRSPVQMPGWLRSLTAFAIILGALTTLYRFLVLRFTLPVSEIGASVTQTPEIANLSHKAYISYLGYSQLESAIPHDAIVQFNPSSSWVFWKNVDLINIDHQVAIAGGQLWCGSELGGDPDGCPAMIAAINPIFEGGTRGEQARVVCHRYGISYLVSNVYDPVWRDKNSWVWTLPPVIQESEFRALSCE